MDKGPPHIQESANCLKWGILYVEWFAHHVCLNAQAGTLENRKLPPEGEAIITLILANC